MATDGKQVTDGGNFLANADLTAKQYYAVKMTTTARKVDLETTGKLMILGILQNKPNTGEAAEVCLFGITKAIAGAAITVGDPLMTDTSSRLITYTSAAVKVGVALTAAGAAGDLITVFVFPAQVSA